MTREEADSLQALMDSFKRLFEQYCNNDLMPRDDKQLPNTSKHISSFMDTGTVHVVRIQLAHKIEAILSESKISGIDAMAVGAVILNAFGGSFQLLDVLLPVVSGHEKIDPESFGSDEFERLYCIKVPGILMKDAMNIRLQRSMVEMSRDK